MTTDEAMLTELQGLLERATAAPWGAINIAGEWELTTLPLSYETPRLGSEERGRGGDDIELAAALRNAYPALRAALLRAERLEGALRGTIGVVLELLRRTASMPEGIPTHSMVRAIEEAHAALAPEAP